nr:immunoglobulin light chain junction region [Macaca mulatta]
CQQYKGLPFTF